jgi:hypothetical protein
LLQGWTTHQNSRWKIWLTVTILFLFQKCWSCWSKNVHEEKDARNQILFGAINSHCCTLLSLASHLECFVEAGAGALTPLVFGTGKGGNNAGIKNNAGKKK